MPEPLLEVRDLKVNLKSGKRREITVVDGVSFSIKRGETLGVVGESGCGKTLTASAVIQLLPPYVGRVSGGEILFEGEDLMKKTPKQMREIRGRKISMIFQNPMSSMNPAFRIGDQMREALRAHNRSVTTKEAREISAEMLRKVGLSLPETRLREYPHELSGGQIQRVMIAMALLSRPSLLIADEPTSALDVTIQAQILELLRTLRTETGASMMLISHDMGAIAGHADNVMVMYAGRVMEYGPAAEIFTNPLHPYTQKLFSAVSLPDMDAEIPEMSEALTPWGDAPSGCRFHTQCPRHTELCQREAPESANFNGHLVFCHRMKRAEQG